ncbi:TPA: hypothetical protein N0F65_003849 [Lagenidium giganteum]|uniref:Complex 1 LYR protein domain-containing protein n=1 Tax=Lagenidium giganteum TaxID=4803 RepID=A0AAV2YTV0_9STRA|nr:TPA: hypothetical protein N0F65_003849 [Lagenidium giganteum]
MSTPTQMTRTSIQLYRDCLRLAKHIGGKSKKGIAIRTLVRREFEKGRDETDPEKIEALKANAVRGLSNYLVLANSSKDKNLRDAMKDQQRRPTEDAGPAQAEFREFDAAADAKPTPAAAAATPAEDGGASGKGVENVTKKLEGRLEAGDFYGALQMYKTLYMRFLKGDDPDASQQLKAIELALDAAVNLLKHDQSKAATEMATLMVTVYVDFEYPVDDENKARIRRINDAFLAKPTFCADQALFLKQAVKWTAEHGSRKRGDPELQLLLARAYQQAKDYTHAAKHYLHAEKPTEFGDMLVQWSKEGYASESDLYLARAVLQLLSLENLRDANKVNDTFIAAYKKENRPVDLPLFNFVRFLLLTLERDALPLFQVLQERYAPALARDPALKSYLSAIGQKFYGLQPPRTGLSSLLEMFSGGM